MKVYSKITYRQHLKDLGKQKKDIFSIEYYYKGIVDIANGFNREWSSMGLLSLNDAVQECHYALIKAWGNLNWDAIHAAPEDEKQPMIWAYLKKSVKLESRYHIHNQRDGVRIPHYKRWELAETKDVNDFITQLFPQMWFWQNDEKLNLVDEPPTRYDIEQLHIGLISAMDKLLTDDESYVLTSWFGLIGMRSSYKQIAKDLNMRESNVRKIKQRALESLRNEEVKNYLQTFYDFQSQT